jgi:hypothetical protein
MCKGDGKADGEADGKALAASAGRPGPAAPKRCRE